MTEMVARIHLCLQRPGFSAVTIAGLAKVHPNTLRDFDKGTWNPKWETLERIMRVVDGITELAES